MTDHDHGHDHTHSDREVIVTDRSGGGGLIAAVLIVILVIGAIWYFGFREGGDAVVIPDEVDVNVEPIDPADGG